MKSVSYILFLFIFSTMLSCDKVNNNKETNYVFVSRYCATITVGGVVGLAEKCFNVGDNVKGKLVLNGMVTIRVAEHSALNDGPPTSASYQEFLNVPSHNLRMVKN